MALNYYAIQKIVGGRASLLPGARFGGFGVLSTGAGIARGRPLPPAHVDFSTSDDRVIARAFERVRDGMAPERVLWDSSLAKKFQREAKRLGVHAPPASINRRLIAIRKNPRSFAERGIKLGPSTVRDPHPSIVAEYAHVIEFALVKLRIRHAASIDDILIDPQLAGEFDAMVTSAAPEVTSTQARLGALYIRKHRHVDRADTPLFERLDSKRMEDAMQVVGSLHDASRKRLSEGPGLVELCEDSKHLYIGFTTQLRDQVAGLANADTLSVLGNEFWTPDPSRIRLRMYLGESFEDVSTSTWQLKLVTELRPAFNWPVVRHDSKVRAA